MKVHELITWLQAFEDQDAVVKVLQNEGGGYYAQGGVTSEVEFNPERHIEYTDYRDNPFAVGQPWAQERTLLLGLDDN
ncbi:hypothetical protein [Segatella copri]|uniref:hypothetical protein n=1 Tax=Segatella copri TaxID=165179 RepID=UPI001F1B8B15|nr:hypothetical protein [Segatella copri]